MIAGALYLIGKKLEGKTPHFFHRLLINFAIAIIVGAALKVLGYASGISLLEFTIAGIIVVAVSLLG